MAECNVEDILCQMTVLGHLKGLQSVLGEERYRADFPELQGLSEKISSREVSLRETLGKCVENPAESELPVQVNAVIEEEE